MYDMVRDQSRSSIEYHRVGTSLDHVYSIIRLGISLDHIYDIIRLGISLDHIIIILYNKVRAAACSAAAFAPAAFAPAACSAAAFSAIIVSRDTGSRSRSACEPFHIFHHQLSQRTVVT